MSQQWHARPAPPGRWWRPNLSAGRGSDNRSSACCSGSIILIHLLEFTCRTIQCANPYVQGEFIDLLHNIYVLPVDLLSIPSSLILWFRLRWKGHIDLTRY